jgi:hypothetical protein
MRRESNSYSRSHLPPGLYTLAGPALPGVTCRTWEVRESPGNVKAEDCSLLGGAAAGSQLGDQEVGWEVPGAHFWP